MRSLNHRAFRFAGALLALSIAPLSAQAPYQVADLGPPVSSHVDDVRETNEIVEAGGLLFFFQNDGSNGRELWRSDGTALGTFMVRDLCPGSCGSRNMYSNPLAAVGNYVFFAGNDGVHGLELWVTDGTAPGTRLVLDLVPGWESSIPRLMTAAAGQLFFVAQVNGELPSLWRSDGTAKGTYRISPAGVSFDESSSILPATEGLFLCNATVSGSYRLWWTDGTEAGTNELAGIHCDYSTWLSGPPGAVLPDGDLIFSGGPHNGGHELWRSDGTPDGTSLLVDLWPGAFGASMPQNFARMGSEIIFNAYTADPPPGTRALFRTDGTAPGTSQIPTPDGLEIRAIPGQFASDGANYYFSAWSPSYGHEPWVFDGKNIQLLADVVPGPQSSLEELFFNRSFFAPVGDALIFPADDGIHGFELWRSDGTVQGTYRISELAPGAESMSLVFGDPKHVPSVHHELFYFFEENAESGYRLLRTNGDTFGPEVVRVLDQQSSNFFPVSRDRGTILEVSLSLSCFEAAGAFLSFDAPNVATSSHDLWVSDGSASGTSIAFEGSQPGNKVLSCKGHDGKLLFFDTISGSLALRSLAPAAGSVEELGLGVGGRTRPDFLDLGTDVAFAMSGGIFESDGTANGTTLLAKTPDLGSSWLASWNGRILVSSGELSITPLEGPHLVQLTNPEATTGTGEVVALTDRVLFVGIDAEHGAELWSSDGLEGDATLLFDVAPGPAGSLARPITTEEWVDWNVPRMVNLEDLAVLSADDGAHGRELWITDGTSLGTYLLKDIYAGDYPSTPRNLTRLGDRIFFTAESELEGIELWSTDGTVAGTVNVKDIATGSASSTPEDLVVRGGFLYFSAWSPNYGREAWRSDGTAAGTVRITDIAPGPKSSSPQRFARTGNRLFFSATDQVHGYELWAISDDGSIPLFLDGFENESTSRWSETGS